MKISNSKERIRELMEEKSITQAEFCRKTGISKAALSNYLSGKRIPRQEAISKIADTFQVSPAWLMGYDTYSSYSGDRPISTREEWFAFMEHVAQDAHARLDIANSNRLLDIYMHFGFDAFHVMEAYLKSPESGKKDIQKYVDYITSLNDVITSSESDIKQGYEPQKEEGSNERKQND